MKKINEILNNGFIKFLLKLVKGIIWVFVILIMVVILIQRIFNNEVSIGSFRMFTVVTGSMVPVYNVNDVIIAKEEEPSKIKKGDDLVYLGEVGDFKDKIVTHRVISIKQKDGDYYFQTKGVANNTSDPIISSDQVYGKIVYKAVILSFLSGILNNSYGLYFLLFVPIAFLIFLEILDRIKDKEEELENEEKESKEA